MMDISWKDEVTNERVRAQTKLEKINLIIKEKIEMARARSTNGQQTAKTGIKVRGTKKAWKTKTELDRHHTTRFEKHRHDLGSSVTAHCQQRKLASKCGPMCL